MFLRSMLSKEVSTPETHRQSDNVETKSPILASCLGHYGTFTRVKWTQIHSPWEQMRLIIRQWK